MHSSTSSIEYSIEFIATRRFRLVGSAVRDRQVAKGAKLGERVCLCSEESNNTRDNPFIQFFWALCVKSVACIIDVIDVTRIMSVIWIHRMQVLKEKRVDFGWNKNGKVENEGGIGLIRIDGNCEENQAEIKSFGRKAQKEVEHLVLHLFTLWINWGEKRHAVDYDVKGLLLVVLLEILQSVFLDLKQHLPCRFYHGRVMEAFLSSIPLKIQTAKLVEISNKTLRSVD